MNELHMMMNRMQEIGNKMGGNELRMEKLLTMDTEIEKMKLPYMHQMTTCLPEVEEHLNDLILDVDKPRTFNHPHARMIEEDMHRLHDRWQNDHSLYRDLHEPISMMGLQSNINRAPLFSHKQVEESLLHRGEQLLADLGNRSTTITPHRLHYTATSRSPTVESRYEWSTSKAEERPLHCGEQLLADLRNSSTTITPHRLHYTATSRFPTVESRYEWSTSKAEERPLHRGEQLLADLRNSSTTITPHRLHYTATSPPPTVESRYEWSTSKAEERPLHRGEQFLADLRNSSTTITPHRLDYTATSPPPTVEPLSTWSTPKAEERPLHRGEQFLADLRNSSTTITPHRLDYTATSPPPTVEPLSARSTPKAEERPLHRGEQFLADLRNSSTTITPHRLDYTATSPPPTVEPLSEWSTPKHSSLRSERFTLKSDTNNADLEAQSSNGTTSSFPPDPETIGNVAQPGKEPEKLKESPPVVSASLKSQPTEQDQKAAAEFVDDHRPELIKRVCSVMEIVDCLKSKNMITAEMYSTIQNTKTSQEKMRELYNVLESGGIAVKAEFYNVLKDKQHCLVEDLEAQSRRA